MGGAGIWWNNEYNGPLDKRGGTNFGAIALSLHFLFTYDNIRRGIGGGKDTFWNIDTRGRLVVGHPKDAQPHDDYL